MKNRMIEDRILSQLLDAEPAELRGEGESEIARLVRSEPGVRAVAERMLRDLRDMDTALATVAASAPARAPTGRSFTAPRLGLATGLAAAVFALLYFARSEPPAPPVGAGTEEPSFAATLDVESDRRFAVFETDNPDIVIVWLFDEEDR